MLSLVGSRSSDWGHWKGRCDLDRGPDTQMQREEGERGDGAPGSGSLAADSKRELCYFLRECPPWLCTGVARSCHGKPKLAQPEGTSLGTSPDCILQPQGF